MSRSSPNLTNPSSHMYEWNGETGTLSYYDKEKGETINVPFSKDKPFEMLILDQLNGVGGWSDQHNIGLWSTEVRSSKDDIMVFAGKRNIYTGPYKDKQGINQVAGFGGRYCKIVYFAHKERVRTDAASMDTWHISRIKLIGVSVTAWIDFNNDQGRQKIENGKVLLTGSTHGKKGKVEYEKPDFECVPASEEEDKQAIALDKVLQSYLDSYLTTPQEDEHDEPSTSFEDAGKATPEQIANFERLKAEKLSLANTGKTANDLDLNDYPDDTQESYNRAATADYSSLPEIPTVFGDEPPFTDDDLPPEYRG